MKKVLDTRFLQLLTTRLLNFSIASFVVLLAVLLAVSLSSCALVAHGPSQNVFVNSKPSGVEVFLEEEFVSTTSEGKKTFLEDKFIGITPIEIRLKRSGTHKLKLRYGTQERMVIIKSRADTGSILLDSIPLAIIGGSTAAACISSGGNDNDFGFGALVCATGVLFSLASTTPLIVDATTESWHELSPDEIMIDFTE